MVKNTNVEAPVVQPKLKLESFHLTKLKFEIGSEHWEKGELPETEFKIRYAQITKPEDKNYLGIEFKLYLQSIDKSVDLIFTFIGHFITSGVEITPEILETPIFRYNAPAILFPYTRAFLSNFILNAGFKPIILPTLNFFDTPFKQKAAEPKPIWPKGKLDNKKNKPT